MFGLFKRRKAPEHKLRRDDVRRLVRQFVDQWPPFRDRYGQASDVDVQWVNDRDGNGMWTANLIPAIDIRCIVLVDDDGRVTEARMIAMRQNSILAQWHHAADAPRVAQEDN